MNRAERRRQKMPKGVTPVDLALLKKEAVDEVMAKVDIEAIKKEAAREATRDAFKLLICIPVMAARDVFNSGKIRNTRLADKCLFYLKGFEQGEITIEQMEEVLKDETGWEFEETREENQRIKVSIERKG